MREITEHELDMLKELASIGVNSAASSLSQMLGGKVSLIIPKIKAVDVEKVKEDLIDPEEVHASVYVKVFGGHSAVLLSFPKVSGLELVDVMQGREKGSSKSFNKMDVSAFNELGNIMVSSYLTSVANFLRTKIDQGLPYMAIDMIGSIIDGTILPIAQENEKVLFTDAQFMFEDHVIEARVYFLLEPDVVLKLIDHTTEMLK